jgi:hypothetical protein
MLAGSTLAGSILAGSFAGSSFAGSFLAGLNLVYASPIFPHVLCVGAFQTEGADLRSSLAGSSAAFVQLLDSNEQCMKHFARVLIISLVVSSPAYSQQWFPEWFSHIANTDSIESLLTSLGLLEEHFMARRIASLFTAVLLCCVFSSCSGILNVGGTWKGKMIQPDGPRGKDFYVIVFDLEQKDSLVSGISRIEIPSTEYYGVMKVRGMMRRDTLYFEEKELLEGKPREGSRWCLKEGILVSKQEGIQLVGSWTAPYCAPGEIELVKVR